ncbi:phospholipase D family protein [Pseudomonas sp. JR33AA]|uniref:phospholipase D family protein n=1 Tax=Pseudomonas sp. JR33AA TaxID=2899113 RepID=UPI001F48D480|nr:phospholipase D family protein [Pseudomonas sp. JR33AA]MCE5977607.1 phospholipase D family protein [Pseudomonas sp. JR33AA]
MRSKQPLFAVLLLTVLIDGCTALNAPHEPSQALPADDSSFGRSILAQVAPHEGRSGFRLFPESAEAFAARAELIRRAQSSIDLQYYIVHDGISTRILLSELLLAADRKVRVRILLDDTTSDDLEETIATLATHPYIQIRVFNPLHLGRSTVVTRTMGRLFNLSQQHRRMHNKLWVVDNCVAIVGGRNLGDEYFDAEPNRNFTDIDMLSVGPVAEQLGHSFDEYWNSALSKPIEQFISFKPTSRDLKDLRTRLDASLEETRTQNHALYQQLMSYTTEPRLNHWRRELIWAWNKALWDAPSKVLADGEPAPYLLLTTQLAPELNGVTKELILVSAYMVPGQPGVVYLTRRADAGVSIRLLTNSLEATDVPAAHGAYAPYRKTLLEHGVQLFELRRQSGDHGNSRPRLFHKGSSNSSDSSLHTKAMIFDQQKAFIGSFNFDSRSLLWNTEVGVLVDDPKLAGRVRELALKGMAPALSYHPRLENAQLVWVTEDNGKQHRLTKEPGSWWRRFNSWLSSTIGLEKML